MIFSITKHKTCQKNISINKFKRHNTKQIKKVIETYLSIKGHKTSQTNLYKK